MRQERKLSQEQFAELVGISVDFLSLIERGRNAPSFETLDLIAERLGVAVRALFDFRRMPKVRETRMKPSRRAR
jgi:transcriptional regulator with XRE-family HTH domain